MKTNILLLTIALLSQLTIAQTVYTVDNRPESGAQFTSLQPAIDAAASGDIIYIHPSPTGYGSVSVTKTLTLVGPGHNPENSDGLRASLTNITLFSDTPNCVFKGLSFNNLSVQGSYGLTNIGDIHIINNRITNGVSGWFNGGTTSPNWVIEGNYFNSAESTTNIEVNGAADWTIQNNYISGVVRDPNRTTLITNNLFVNADASGGAEIFSNSSDIVSPLVTNNVFIFTDADVTNITNSGSTPIVYTNCLLWNSGEGVASDMDPLPGSGNLNNIDPIFSAIPTAVNDFYNNDYTLGGGSPAIGTATDGGDIGVFGRNFPFDINGRPNSMPYSTEMTILNTVVQPGQDLNVIFKAAQKN